MTRPTMRGRPRRTNPAYGRVVIDYDRRLVSISFDDRRPLESPADGTRQVDAGGRRAVRPED